MRVKRGYVVIMSKTTTLTALAAQVEELTKTQNRIREVIRANSISDQGLDPKGIIEMSDSDYAEHRAALQKISDEFAERRQVLETGIPSPTRDFSEDELEDVIVEHQINQISTAVANKRKALNEMVERQAAEVAEELAHGFAN